MTLHEFYCAAKFRLLFNEVNAVSTEKTWCAWMTLQATYVKNKPQQ